MNKHKIYFLTLTLFLLLSSIKCNKNSLDDINFRNDNLTTRNYSNEKIKDNNMVHLNFICDEQYRHKCKKARKSIENAAFIINNTFDLRAQIKINASFIPICKTIEHCPPGQPEPLGAAKPSKFIPLLDNDNSVRLYPQALYKQLQTTEHVDLSNVDIIAVFNSKSSVFWFKGDKEIEKNQVDFEIVVLHELLHGLGFISSWNDYFNSVNPSILTPFPLFTNKKNELIFDGFQEYVLDRHLILTNSSYYITNITNRLNQFYSNIVFGSKEDFAYEFISSPQYLKAKEMFNYGVTKNSVSFKFPDESETVIMETSLVPYLPESSFTHIDYETYHDTTDFLMRYKAPRQIKLDDLNLLNGNNSEYTNPIGPKTVQIMKTIG